MDSLSAESECDPHCLGVGPEVEVIRHGEGGRSYCCDEVALVHHHEGAGRGLVRTGTPNMFRPWV